MAPVSGSGTPVAVSVAPVSGSGTPVAVSMAPVSGSGTPVAVSMAPVSGSETEAPFGAKPTPVTGGMGAKMMGDVKLMGMGEKKDKKTMTSNMDMTKLEKPSRMPKDKNGGKRGRTRGL